VTLGETLKITTDISDLPHTGLPRTASLECSKQDFVAFIKADQSAVVRDVIAWHGIGHSAVQEMISKLIKHIDINQGSRNCCTLTWGTFQQNPWLTTKIARASVQP
jgi:hypothetical protein